MTEKGQNNALPRSEPINPPSGRPGKNATSKTAFEVQPGVQREIYKSSCKPQTTAMLPSAASLPSVLLAQNNVVLRNIQI